MKRKRGRKIQAQCALKLNEAVIGSLLGCDILKIITRTNVGENLRRRLVLSVRVGVSVA